MPLNESSGFVKIARQNRGIMKNLPTTSITSFFLSFFLGMFRPPWGGIFVLTSIFLIGLGILAEKGLEYCRNSYYLQDVQTAEPEDVPKIVQKLTEDQRNGTVALVEGMNSSRECVATACFEALRAQIGIWKELPKKEAALRYSCLVGELWKQSERFGPTALKNAAAISRFMENEILPLGIPGQIDIGIKCQYVITRWESTLPKSVPDTPFGQAYPLFVFGGESEPKISSSPTPPTPQQASQGPVSESLSDPSQHLVKSGNISSFLSEKLLRITPELIEHLPTQDLMRLLNHPVWEISQSAETILRERDDFQDVHIDLASCLYHGNPKIRLSLLRQLKKAKNLELTTWLMELLHDPDTEVRYETAISICRGDFPINDYQSFFKVIYADTDSKIVDLVRPIDQIEKVDPIEKVEQMEQPAPIAAQPDKPRSF